MSCIDFTQPLLPDAPRLRCQFGALRQVLRADAGKLASWAAQVLDSLGARAQD